MDPQEYLDLVEAIEGLTELMDRARGSLIQKGWTQEGAEAGAIAIYEGTVGRS